MTSRRLLCCLLPLLKNGITKSITMIWVLSIIFVTYSDCGFGVVGRLFRCLNEFAQSECLTWRSETNAHESLNKFTNQNIEFDRKLLLTSRRRQQLLKIQSALKFPSKYWCQNEICQTLSTDVVVLLTDKQNPVCGNIQYVHRGQVRQLG